ncbi:MAG TPA: hypothetical protein VMJ35_15975 [Dongiaceae bacterium]|nr:hypothetical protein [Dongiaceae bacterium]
MSNLTSLENQVLQKLLQGDDEALGVLRDQASHAEVSSREATGVGFFTKFSLPPGAPRLAGRPTFKLGDVNGKADNLKRGLGFLLYVDDGAISTLEGYTYDEPWPDEVLGLTLTYSAGDNRDLSWAKGLIHKK